MAKRAKDPLGRVMSKVRERQKLNKHDREIISAAIDATKKAKSEGRGRRKSGKYWELPDKKYYVTMTDKFMSGWGAAKGKINKVVIGCDTLQEAYLIEKNAKRRPEMANVRIARTKPRYSKKEYVVSYYDFKELGAAWKK